MPIQKITSGIIQDGAVAAADIVSVSNTAITGNIISSQITSVANTQITGNIISSQITSVANTQLTGLIQAAQIGSANATLVTSGTLPGARLPANSVLQVVTTNLTTEQSTTSSSFVTTTLAATITPTSSNSKIFIIVSGNFDNNALNVQSFVTLYRGATNIGAGGNGMGNLYGNASRLIVPIAFNFLDSPATTSATTYTVYYSSSMGTIIRWGQGGAQSTITLMEISA